MRTFKITVTGKGEFPWDMLRFAGAYPATTTDAMNLPVTDENRRDYRTIELICHGDSQYAVSETYERFRSFLWTAEYEELR